MKACMFFASGYEECEALIVVDMLRRANVDIDAIKTIVGDENVVTATLNPANATTNVIYKSQNTDVARVVGEDKNVTIKAVGLGKTKVIATTDNGLTAEVSVNVTGVHTERLTLKARQK